MEATDIAVTSWSLLQHRTFPGFSISPIFL